MSDARTSPPKRRTSSSALSGDRVEIQRPGPAVVSRRSRESNNLDLQHTRSHVSHHDMHAATEEYREAGDEVYDRFPNYRKLIITAVLSFCGFLTPMASTSVLAAIPEIADTYNTNGSIINVSNALYLAFMGLAPLVWGPLGQVYGRRWVCISTAALYTAFSAGSALAPNLAAFFIFRMLTAFQGTSFLIVGSSCIGDIYKPTERGTALSWFLSGTLIGPAFGPFLGGIIVTYATWREILWLLTGLGGAATILVFFLLPETIHQKRSEDLKGLTRKEKRHRLWQWTNPFRVIRLYRYPNLITTAIASSALVWNMYSLLTPIRYVLNPRFHLSSPMQSGLFYIAPGCGYVAGTFVGGRWADHIVKRWIGKRGGQRVPEDRLRSCLSSMGVVIPACMLIYGWSIEKEKGGVPLPVVVMFIQGVAQLMCFPSLNTYCLDVMQSRSGEVIAGNYVVRYFFAGMGTAVCLPAIETIGVGWFSTISAIFLVISALSVYATTIWGRQWREKVDAKKAARMAEKNDNEMQGDTEVQGEVGDEDDANSEKNLAADENKERDLEKGQR
ncbi:major facilitator superfamily domain-containing protein [Lineolata rhizophorae]|uniref:Major facilitator superfamily domain-containing protein n=1 Tax=Lineolata rhizophorae TaxID=578093 RepID=A0A6A6PFA2_9PEZI|nr:major facilitator superfamily domain-containing protein [Lineolata rhizophorae]